MPPVAPEFAWGMTYAEFLRVWITVAFFLSALSFITFGIMWYLRAMLAGFRSGFIISGFWNSLFFMVESGVYVYASWFQTDNVRLRQSALLCLPFGIIAQVIVNDIWTVLSARRYRDSNDPRLTTSDPKIDS